MWPPPPAAAVVAPAVAEVAGIGSGGAGGAPDPNVEELAAAAAVGEEDYRNPFAGTEPQSRGPASTTNPPRTRTHTHKHTHAHRTLTGAGASTFASSSSSPSFALPQLHSLFVRERTLFFLSSRSRIELLPLLLRFAFFASLVCSALHFLSIDHISNQITDDHSLQGGFHFSTCFRFLPQLLRRHCRIFLFLFIDAFNVRHCCNN